MSYKRLLRAGVPTTAIVAEVTSMNLRVDGRVQWRLDYDFQDHQGRPYRQKIYLPADEAKR